MIRLYLKTYYNISSCRTDVECENNILKEYELALYLSPYFHLFNLSPLVLKNPKFSSLLSLCLRLHRCEDLKTKWSENNWWRVCDSATSWPLPLLPFIFILILFLFSTHTLIISLSQWWRYTSRLPFCTCYASPSHSLPSTTLTCFLTSCLSTSTAHAKTN